MLSKDSPISEIEAETERLKKLLPQEAIMNQPEWKRFRAHIFERAVSLFQTALLAGVLTVLCLILSRI